MEDKLLPDENVNSEAIYQAKKEISACMNNQDSEMLRGLFTQYKTNWPKKEYNTLRLYTLSLLDRAGISVNKPEFNFLLEGDKKKTTLLEVINLTASNLSKSTEEQREFAIGLYQKIKDIYAANSPSQRFRLDNLLQIFKDTTADLDLRFRQNVFVLLEEMLKKTNSCYL